jgi:hypothetical protein
MAICASCGKEIRDDIWTCGYCGAPVAQSSTGASDASGGEDSAYGNEGYNPYASQAAASSAYGAAAYGGVEPGAAGFGAATEGMTAYGTPMPQAKPAKSGGLSSTMKLVLAIAAVAVVAIVAVWFLVLRGQGGGDQFVGTWTAVSSDQGSLVVKRGDDGLVVTMVGTDKQSVGPLKTDLDGQALEIKLEAVGDDAQQKAAVDMVRALFEATVEDFKMILRVRDADGHLLMNVSGKSKVGGDEATMPVTEFVKAGVQTL